MKTKVLFSVAGVLLIASVCMYAAVQSDKEDTSLESLTIRCTPELSTFMQSWAGAYNALQPAVSVEVTEASPESIHSGPAEGLTFLTSLNTQEGIPLPDWKMVVGRHVVVPFCHEANPFYSTLASTGVSPASLAKAISDPSEASWGSLLDGALEAPLHVYVQDDEGVRAMLGTFLGEPLTSFRSIRTGTSAEVVRWVQEDPLAIGFCNAVEVQGAGASGLKEDLRLLPVDKNGNGTIDPVEDIYADYASLQRAVWIGKYPRALYSNICVVNATLPADEASLAFLKWIMAEGQQQMLPAGYCGLESIESQSNLARLEPGLMPLPEKERTASLPLVLGVLLCVGIAAGVGIRRHFRAPLNHPVISREMAAKGIRPLEESKLDAPEGLYYDKTHTWAFMEKNGWVSVGLDDFMQHLVGPISRVMMKSPGETVRKGELLFSIVQSGKQLSIYSPLSGTIRKNNEALHDHSSALNESPYAEGWVYVIEPSNWAREVQWLKVGEKYRNWISVEFTRVKDFLAASLKPANLEHAYVALQDGGVLKDGVLADFGPEVWAEFQSSFLDMSR